MAFLLNHGRGRGDLSKVAAPMDWMTFLAEMVSMQVIDAASAAAECHPIIVDDKEKNARIRPVDLGLNNCWRMTT